MGLVYSAVDEVLERKVAVKLIRSNLHPASFRKRFMLEARAMALVSHPNVLTIHALGEHEQNPFIVMELVEGQTLDDWIALRRFHPNLDVSLELGRPRQHHSPFGPRALEPRSLWALRAGPSARIRDALGLLGFLESRCP